MSRAYYNENDKFAAAWLRELITRGLIANGDVDERSIAEVTPDDIAGYTQCHWFAGIGGWSYALRLAGWPDDREVWTGSCPCQPFSAAGRQQGTKDARHLWPFWLPLIAECRPVVVFGEQVEAAINHGWLDLVCADLEREDYAVAAVGLPAASVGAPHRRQRLWFVAGTERGGRREECQDRRGLAAGDSAQGRTTGLESGSGDCRMADSQSKRRDRGETPAGSAGRHVAAVDGSDCRVAHPNHAGPQGRRREELRERAGERAAGSGSPSGSVAHSASQRRAGESVLLRPEEGGRESSPLLETTWSGPLGPAWSDADWLPCADGKARPVEPGTFPLAHGVPARVGRLRGYGNAIVPQVAAEVIRAYMACRG